MNEQIKKNVLETVRLLAEKIKANPELYFFNDGADILEIIDFEVETCIILPYSYKCFISYFNGGFISRLPLKNPAENIGELETLEWNSNHIFGLDEIAEHFQKLKGMNWKNYDENPEHYPFIPVCQTESGEYLIFVNLLNKDEESPVFDAFHEEFPSSWGTLYNNFGELLSDYVHLEGLIDTTSYEEPTVAEYLKKSKEF